MKSFRTRAYALIVAGCILLAGCVAPTTQDLERVAANFAPLPERPLYMIGRGIANEWIEGITFNTNELVIVDRDTWQITHRRQIRSNRPEWLRQDATGRLWTGYTSRPGEAPDTRVQIFDRTGQLLETLRTCRMPGSGVHFIGDRAYIGCWESGFYGGLAVVDTEKLEVTDHREIHTEGDNFMHLALAGDDERVVLYGAGESTTRLVVIEPDTLETVDVVNIGFVSTRDILVSENTYYVLNNASHRHPEGIRNDLIVVDFSVDPPEVEEITLPHPSPAWGALVGSQLYMLHGPDFGLTSSLPERHLSRLDLVTGETEAWPLEDGLRILGIAVVDGEILLGVGRGTDRTSGLHRFDPETGELTLLAEHPGWAFRILQPLD